MIFYYQSNNQKLDHESPTGGRCNCAGRRCHIKHRQEQLAKEAALKQQQQQQGDPSPADKLLPSDPDTTPSGASDATAIELPLIASNTSFDAGGKSAMSQSFSAAQVSAGGRQKKKTNWAKCADKFMLLTLIFVSFGALSVVLVFFGT